MIKQILTGAVCAISLAMAADVAVVEEIIAKVNGDIITRGEIERQRKLMETEMRSRAPKGMPAAQLNEVIAERQKDVLRDKIDNLLLINRGKELNINVDSEVTKYIADLQRQTKIADQEKFAAMVREQTGSTFEDWKSEMRNSMLTQRVVRQEVGSKINITKDEIRKYYDEHKADFVRQEQIFLREILLVTENKTPAEQAAIEKKAKDLVARARKGERFAELARDNSEAESAQNFGDIGGFKKEDLADIVRNATWEQPKGFVTDPIKVQRGWLIFRVEEKYQAGQAALEEVENEIMGRLYEPRMGPAMRKYLTELRLNAFLEIREGWMDSSAAPGKSTKWTDPAQLKPETISKQELDAQTRRKRLLWMVPIPGTKTSVAKKEEAKAVAKEGTSKSKAVKQ